MDDKFGFMTPRPSTTVPSTPQALNMRLSDPESSSTASILTPMTNRPLASGSGPRLPFTGSFKGAPLTPSSGGGGSSSSISSSKSRGLREEAKTSSARYHQRASGIPKQKPPIKKSPSSAPPAPPPNTLSFAQKLRVWVFKYYGKSAERDNLAREHAQKISNMEHLVTLQECLAEHDYELLTYGWKLKKEAKYDKALAFYKALRNLYHYSKKEEFKSKIDRDGDWIMGYLFATYFPA